MTDQPWEDPDRHPGDKNEIDVPGPEDGPVTAPPDEPPVSDDGDLELGERPDGQARASVDPTA